MTSNEAPQSKFGLDGILTKVRALLATADHPNTPPAEADTARNMAEALMFKYKIDELNLAAAQKAAGIANALAPVWRTIKVCDAYGEFESFYRQMASSIVHHVGGRGVLKTVRKETATADGSMASHEVILDAVGYESDLRYAEMLLLSVTMEFGKRLEPKYDPSLSDQVNAYLMRSAGMEGRRIAMAIYGRDDKALRPKVRGMFKAEAIARGEDPTPLLGKGVNVKLFRESFARGFDQELWSRLNMMRAARGEGEQGLVLADAKHSVDEAFYTKYPQYRPSTAPALPPQPGQSQCPKCAAAKSGYCRDHQWLKPRKSDYVQVDRTAYQRGTTAARNVDLGSVAAKLETPRKELG